MQDFQKLDKIMVFSSFKFVLLVNVQILLPFKNPKVWEMQQFNFEKNNILPNFRFYKYCVVVSVLTVEEHCEETLCHFRLSTSIW